MKLRKGFSMLLAALLLLLSAAALAECNTYWYVTRTQHVKVCRGCSEHKKPTYVTKRENHSLYLAGYSWPDQVEPTNGEMPRTVTVTHNSWITVACKVCGDLEDHQPRGATEQATLESSTPVTCTTDGSYTYAAAGLTSSNPDAYLYGHTLHARKTYTVKALGHDWSGKDGRCARAGCDATCAHEEAQQQLTCTEGTPCTVCGKALEPLDHDWSGKDGRCVRAGCDATCAHEEAQQQLTCTEGTTCAVCGKALEALGHDWSEKDGRCARAGCDATCAHEEAQQQLTCTEGTTCAVCGKALEPLGHDYQTEIVKPTCENKGFLRYTCTRCGDAYTEDTAKKLCHWFGEWTPKEDKTHRAVCLRKGCDHVGQVACQEFAYVLQAEEAEAPEEIRLCPVCGALTDGLRLELLDQAMALAVTEELPGGEVVVRMGETKDGTALMSVAFELGGTLLLPQGQIRITLPTSAVEGYALLLVDATGAETELPVELSEDEASFLLDFTTAEGQESSPVRLIHLVSNP